jgi:hypothetical protein
MTMVDILLLYRTPIATVLGVAVAVAAFFIIDSWFLATPIAFAAMIATGVAWGIFLDVIERLKF